MKVIADNEVLSYLKSVLSEKGHSAVRFQLAEACCGLAELDFIYDDKKADDICVELDGVNFVVSNEFGFLLNTIEMEKTPLGIDIKRSYR